MFNFTMHTATPEHLALLQRLVLKVKGTEGQVLELGCFEGRSSIAICEVAFPDVLHCVDTWEGGIDGFGHDKSSYIRFTHNMHEADCSYIDYPMDMFEYLKSAEKESYKFIYLDASHDYESVIKGIEACLPLLVKGGILAGDDILTASRAHPSLNGGVQRAVEESFPSFHHEGNMWWIVREQ